MLVMVRIALFKNRRRFASSHINSSALHIKGHVAVDTDTWERSHDFARVGIKNDEPCRLAGGDKNSMVGFIKHHRMAKCASGKGHLATSLPVSRSTTPTSSVPVRFTYSFLPARSITITSLELPRSEER